VTPPAPDSGAQQEPAGSVDQRLDRVESAVERLAGLVEKIVPGSHAEAQQRTETRLDRASSVQEEVRAELARAKQEQAAEAAAANEKSEREQMRADLAALREKPPAAPVARRTRLLGWG